MLGKFPLPVEVIRFAQALVSKKISALGPTIQLRKDTAGEPFITDEGHHILDCHFEQIPDPPALAYTLSEIPGVVEHGLFIDLADVLLVGTGRRCWNCGASLILESSGLNVARRPPPRLFPRLRGTHCLSASRQLSIFTPTLFDTMLHSIRHGPSKLSDLRTVPPSTGFGMSFAFLIVVEGKHCAED